MIMYTNKQWRGTLSRLQTNEWQHSAFYQAFSSMPPDASSKQTESLTNMTHQQDRSSTGYPLCYSQRRVSQGAHSPRCVPSIASGKDRAGWQPAAGSAPALRPIVPSNTRTDRTASIVASFPPYPSAVADLVDRGSTPPWCAGGPRQRARLRVVSVGNWNACRLCKEASQSDRCSLTLFRSPTPLVASRQSHCRF